MAASPFSEPHNPGVSAEQPWVDSKFSPYDSDIEFKSSDGFVFQLHHSVLGITTGGFPGSEMPTNGEIVPLTEPANVLAILFAFLYSKPQLKLHGMEFKLLLEVAEAAAKYQVFSAVDICNEQLSKFLPKHAPEILDHTIKHDYPWLVSQTLPHFALKPLLPTLERLRPQYMIPYARYHEAWASVFKELTQIAFSRTLQEDSGSGLKCVSTGSHSYDFLRPITYPQLTLCSRCRGSLFVAITYLQTLTSVETLREALVSPDKDPNFQQLLCCNRGSSKSFCAFLDEMIKSCQEKIDAIPSFGTFLGLKL